jgi:LPXTG-motif cell wall-anchored protein
LRRGLLVFIVGTMLFILTFCYVDIYGWLHGYAYPNEPITGGWWDTPEVMLAQMLLFYSGIVLMLFGAYMLIRKKKN